MKRNRDKMAVTEEQIEKVMTFEKLQKRIESELPPNILHFVKNKFEVELLNLYYPSIYIIPLSVDGEQYREYLQTEWQICEYGCSEYNFEFDNTTYLAILVNND